MAEVLGVVASGIAVGGAAGQIGSGIAKLRRLWTEVKDVPETINSLMQKLELLAVVIGEMETIQQTSIGDATRPFNSRGMQLSMMRCREAMSTLDDLVNKLTKHIDSEKRPKRAKAKVKVALAKDILAQCQNRLRDAVQLLQFAQGCCQMSISGAVLQRLMTLPIEPECDQEQKIVVIEASKAEQLDTSDLAIMSAKRRRPWVHSWYGSKRNLGPFATCAWNSHKSKDELGFSQQAYYARLELARWLSGKSWEIQVTRAISGWHHHLRTYNIVPATSEVIRCAEDGDVDRMKYLFENNMASVHDLDQEGKSLLLHSVTGAGYTHRSSTRRNYEMTQFLVNCGLDITERTSGWIEPLKQCFIDREWDSHLSWLFAWWQSSTTAVKRDVVDMRYVQDIIEHMTSSSFVLFQPTIQPDFYATPLLERVQNYLTTTEDHFSLGVTDAKLFRSILDPNGMIRKEDMAKLTSSGINLLSIAMRSYISAYGERLYDETEWNQLMLELILLTDDHSFHSKGFKFHNKTGWEHSIVQGTALWTCIYSAAFGGWHGTWRRRGSPDKQMRRRVFGWLKMLQDCNVDLVSYGQREHEIIFGGNQNRYEIRVPGGGAWMWTGFSWGPNPEDWTIHLDRVVERFVGRFWNWVNNPDLHVPGAWIDDRRGAYFDNLSEIGSDDEGS